jgi:hypothetical protein
MEILTCGAATYEGIVINYASLRYAGICTDYYMTSAVLTQHLS